MRVPVLLAAVLALLALASLVSLADGSYVTGHWVGRRHPSRRMQRSSCNPSPPPLFNFTNATCPGPDPCLTCFLASSTEDVIRGRCNSACGGLFSGGSNGTSSQPQPGGPGGYESSSSTGEHEYLKSSSSAPHSPDSKSSSSAAAPHYDPSSSSASHAYDMSSSSASYADDMMSSSSTADGGYLPDSSSAAHDGGGVPTCAPEKPDTPSAATTGAHVHTVTAVLMLAAAVTLSQRL